MPSTLSVRSIREEDITSYGQGGVSGAQDSGVVLPTFPRSQSKGNLKLPHRQARYGAPSSFSSSPRTLSIRPIFPGETELIPSIVPAPQGRRVPILVRANRALRTMLVAMCGIAILGYGLDVAATHDCSKLQDQARRLNEQNSELSAQLLKAISYQGIQENVLGKFGLHTAEHVIVVKEVPPPQVPIFKARKHSLPLMAGF